MWEYSRGVGGAGWVIFLSKIGWRPSEARYLIDVVDQEMAQLHKIDWAQDREKARTERWLLDTGVTEHGALFLGVSRKYGVNNGEGRVSGGNERGRENKILSVSNVNSRYCNHRTLDGSTL